MSHDVAIVYSGSRMNCAVKERVVVISRGDDAAWRGPCLVAFGRGYGAKGWTAVALLTEYEALEPRDELEQFSEQTVQ